MQPTAAGRLRAPAVREAGRAGRMLLAADVVSRPVLSSVQHGLAEEDAQGAGGGDRGQRALS
eukprot:6915770-Prymnesium_polylepis.1